MTLPVFPSNVRGLAYPVDKTSEFNTVAQKAPNLIETTVAQTYNPVWNWELTYEFLFDNLGNLLSGETYTDYRILQGFMLACGGKALPFLYEDPTDNAVGPALISGSPNPQAQLQLIAGGSPTVYYSPIQRNFGGQFFEDVTDLNGLIAVYANGVLKTLGTDYTIVGPGLALPGFSFMGLVIQWNAMPTGPINAQFNFYFRARFAEDKQGFSQFLAQFWTAGGGEAGTSTYLTLKSARPVLV
jgi:hypothetical protein